MPETAYIIQSPQFGVETTAGTPVAATKRLGSVSVAPAPQMNNTARVVPGYRYPVAVTRGKRWTEASFDGFLSYTDITYLLSSLLKKATPTAGSGGDAAARTWVFGSNLNQTDDPQTYTVEVGDSTLARRFANGLVTSLTMSTEDDGVAVSGSMIGKALELGVTQTPTPTQVAVVPAAAVDYSVGFASTFTGAATALTRALSVSVEFSERWKPLFNVSTDESFVGTNDSESGLSVKLMLVANAAAEQLITDQKDGTLKFFDWTMQGALIPSCSTAKYQTKIRAAVNVTEVSEYKDEDGAYAFEVTLTGVQDPTTNKTVEVTVVNNLTAL